MTMALYSISYARIITEQISLLLIGSGVCDILR